MACFCPLFIFIWWLPPKKVCQLWHGNLFPYIYLGVDPFTYLYLVFYPQQPQPKTHLPTHPFFSKNHSCSCPSSWSKKNAISGRLSLCRLVCCEEPSQAMSLQLHLLPHQGQGAHQGLVLLWLEPSLACGFWTSFFSFFFLEPSSGLSSDSSSSSSISGMGRPWASLTPLPISGMALLE